MWTSRVPLIYDLFSRLYVVEQHREEDTDRFFFINENYPYSPMLSDSDVLERNMTC